MGLAILQLDSVLQFFFLASVGCINKCIARDLRIRLRRGCPISISCLDPQTIRGALDPCLDHVRPRETCGDGSVPFYDAVFGFHLFHPRGPPEKKGLYDRVGLNGKKRLASWKSPGSAMVGPTRSIVQVVGTDFPP